MKNVKKLTAAFTAAAATLSLTVGSFAAMLTSVDAADIASMTAVELVEDMGTGYNLGNSFDSVNTWDNPLTVEKQETAWGNPVTTKSMIDSLAFYGINTVRIPVTWMGMMNADGKIDEAYLARIKEVVDYCRDNDMYVILNIHHDGLPGNWLNAGVGAKDKFQSVWTQIATYFKDYDRHLAFEGWNEVEWSFSDVTTMGQAFVDAVRAVGGGNADRLLIIPGRNTNYADTTSSSYVLPQDKANMLAVDIHYYDPTVWTVYSDDDDSWGYGMVPQNTWGSDAEVAKVKNDIAALKSVFTDKGYGVILGEYGVENYNKDEDDRMLFTQTVASNAYAADGVCAILWDASNAGDMRYFDRNTQTWLNASMGEFYKELTGGSYENPDGLILTDRVVITGELDKKAMVWDLNPFAGKAVIKEVIWSYTAEGVGTDGYYGNFAAQMNMLSDSITNPTTDDYHWSYQPTSVSDKATTYTTSFTSGWQQNDASGKGFLVEGESVVYDYFKIDNWYLGATDGVIPTITFDEKLTVVFEEPIWVTKDFQIPDETPTEPPTETDVPIETVEYTDAPTETDVPIETVEYTDAPTDAPDGSGKWGDTNDDGVVDIADVIDLCKASMGSFPMTDQGAKNADVDQNGKADTTDASYILQSLIGLITLPVQK